MEQRRPTAFAERARTRIWEEQPHPQNPYLATAARCHGYALDDMVSQLDYPGTLFLLLRGELPTPAQSALLQRFLVAFCNPGPRHAATRAVMNAAASGTRSADLGAIGLTLLGGEHLGSAEVENSARFIARSRDRDPLALAAQLGATGLAEGPGDRRIAPGFGSCFGDVDPLATSLAGLFAAEAEPAGPLQWSMRFAAALEPAGCGWLMPGLAAALCCEMGFGARAAGLLFQIAALPGLLAHGLEMAGQGITAMPFIADEDYLLLDDAAEAPA
jgi:citrate synthase